MVALEQALSGLVALFALILALAFVLKHIVGVVKTRRLAARAERRLGDFDEREEINRLRGRDVEAFAKLLNDRRARLGGVPIPVSVLREHQFDTEYEIDFIEANPAKLKRIKKKLKEAAREGEEVALKEEEEETV